MPTKDFKERFASFFEAPSREGFRELLKTHSGETDAFDFKADWPEFSKVARHVLAIANTSKGAMVFGVSQNSDGTFEPTGLTKLVDKAEIENGVKKFLPSTLRFEVVNFSFDASEYPKIVGKKFQVLFVESEESHLPYISKAEGKDIKAASLYVRRGTESEPADHDEFQFIINKRIETGYSTSREVRLEEHLQQLKLLYSYIPTTITSFGFGSFALAEIMAFSTPNPMYPKETLEAFVARAIEDKKRMILQVLGVEANKPK